MEPKNELQRNAITEARRKELETYQRALDIQWLNSRMEDGRMGRCIALIQKEAEMEKDFQERTDHAALVNARAEKEISLGVEIAKVQNKEACTLLRRHYLRENDPCLRELTRKLQAGYVCRDLQQQILHNEYKRLQEKAEENQANQVLQNSLCNDKEVKEIEEKQKMDKNRKYCLELQQQLVNRQSQKQCEYEEMLIEKKMLEDIERTLADEDQRDLKQKQEQTEKLRNEMVTFKQAKEAWKENQKRIVILEEREIEKQKKAATDRSSAIIAERERKVREKDEINKIICAKIMAEEASRLERENLIRLLQEQEFLEKNVQDDKLQKAKLERVKRETKSALQGQMDTRKRLEKEMRERESDFRKNDMHEFLEKNVQDDKVQKAKLERVKRETKSAFQGQLDTRKRLEREMRERESDFRKNDMHEFLEKNVQDDKVQKAKLERVKRETKSAFQGQLDTRKRLEREMRERESDFRKNDMHEFLEKNVQDDKVQKAKLERVKRETKSALQGQMDTRKRLEREMRERESDFRKNGQLDTRKRLEREMRERESDFRKNLELKMAAEDAKAADKERIKKEKKHKYQMELRQQIQDNALRREKDKELEESRAKRVWETGRAWREEVSEEMQKILCEHAPHTRGYLQAGVLAGLPETNKD